MLHCPARLQGKKKPLFEYKAGHETEMLSLLFGSQNEVCDEINNTPRHVLQAHEKR